MHTYQVKPSSSSLVARVYQMSSSSPEKQTKPKSYNQSNKNFKPKSRELLVKQVWPSTQMLLYYHKLISKEKENWHKPNIPDNPSS